MSETMSVSADTCSVSKSVSDADPTASLQKEFVWVFKPVSDADASDRCPESVSDADAGAVPSLQEEIGSVSESESVSVLVSEADASAQCLSLCQRPMLVLGLCTESMCSMLRLVLGV